MTLVFLSSSALANSKLTNSIRHLRGFGMLGYNAWAAPSFGPRRHSGWWRWMDASRRQHWSTARVGRTGLTNIDDCSNSQNSETRPGPYSWQPTDRPPLIHTPCVHVCGGLTGSWTCLSLQAQTDRPTAPPLAAMSVSEIRPVLFLSLYRLTDWHIVVEKFSCRLVGCRTKRVCFLSCEPTRQANFVISRDK